MKFLKLPELETQSTQVLGPTYEPNMSFKFKDLYESGYEMTLVRVQHDPGYYLIAIHFVWKNNETGDVRVFQSNSRGFINPEEGSEWSEFMLEKNERIFGI